MFSFFRQSFRQWARSGTRTPAQKGTVRRLQCEALEDRVLLSLAGAEILANTSKPKPQIQAASATSSNGSSVVVWTEVKGSADRDIKAQRFDALGGKAGGEILVASGGSPQHSPSVAMDAQGDFVILWTHNYSSADQDIHGALYNANGTRASNEFTVAGSPRNEFDASVGMAANGDFVVSYTFQFGNTDRDIKAVQYRANGSVARTIDVAAGSRVEDKSEVAVAADGRFAVAYQSQDNIFVSRYSSTGVRLGSTAVANTTSVEREPDVAIDNYGNVLVVWQQLNGTNWNVVGRSVSSTGALGSLFTVASTSAQETLPSVAIDSSTGKSAVAYQSQSGSPSSVMVAELSATRSIIRTSAVGTGLADPVISLGGSAHRFLVVSQSIGSRGGDTDGGIFARFGVL